MAHTTAAAAGVSPVDKGLVARVIGVITSPRDTFQAVVARPRWFGVLALTTVVIAIGAAVPLTTDAGKQATLDQQVRVTESLTGRQLSDDEYDKLQQRMGIAPFTTGGAVLVFGPVWAAILAGLLWAIFNAAMGGDASYKQVFSIVAHAGVISMLGAMFTAPINYVRGTVSTSTANLHALLPMIDDNSFIGRLLGAIDFFIIWWVLVLAIGLAVLYKRRTQPIALALLAAYALIAVAIAVVTGRFGGGA